MHTPAHLRPVPDPDDASGFEPPPPPVPASVGTAEPPSWWEDGAAAEWDLAGPDQEPDHSPDPERPPMLLSLDALEGADREDLERIRAHVAADPADLRSWPHEVPRASPIPGLIQLGDVTLWSAAGGAGKSLVLFLLLCLLACGAGGLFLNTYQLPDRPVRPLLFDAECGAPRLRRRLRELVLGGALSAEQADLALENMVVFSADGLRHRELLLRAAPALALLYRADLVVIDPLRVLLPAGVDENSNVDVGAVLDELVGASARFGFATVIVDHDSKTGTAARGASAKGDAASFVVHMTRPDADTPTYLELRVTKGRDPGAPPFVALERIEGDRTAEGLHPVRFEKTEPRSKESRATSASSRRERVARAVREHFAAARTGMGIRAIAAATNLPKTSVLRDLDHLEALGVITVTKPTRRGEPALVYPAAAVEVGP